jgi:hypothetical protein
VSMAVLIRCRAMRIAALLAASLAPFAGGATELRLTDLDGNWQGVGIDRASPMESAQQVTCKSTFRTEASRVVSDATCTGQAGLRRVSRLTLSLHGNEITGTLEQTTTTLGSNAPPTVVQGSVSGRRMEDAATLQVRFPGLMPSATLSFKFINSSSYSVEATALGILMMQATYSRMGGR